MRTAGDIANRALVRSGVIAAGETPTAAELKDAVTTLSDMLDSWSLERLCVFGTREMQIPISGRNRITIGPTGDLIDVRPNTVTSAFIRTSTGDTALKHASPEFMDSIRYKDGGSAPPETYWMSYEGAMPDGVVQLWPVTNDGVLHLRVTAPIVQLTDINDNLDLPPGWFHALTLNLAVNLCEEYGFAVTGALAIQATQAKANIKRANIQPPVSTFDPALIGRFYDGN